jgi:hypothetical protein
MNSKLNSKLKIHADPREGTIDIQISENMEHIIGDAIKQLFPLPMIMADITREPGFINYAITVDEDEMDTMLSAMHMMEKRLTTGGMPQNYCLN